MPAYIQQFTICFGVLLVAAYLVPAGVLHWIVAVRPTPEIETARIQRRRPRREDVRREVRQSLAALVFFALYSVALLAAYRAGRALVYWNPSDYPLWWAPLSVVVAMVLHDTWFYWTHRAMHLRWVFPWLHAGHHRSITPTAWAMLSFQPLETVPQFAFFALLIFFVPMHPVALLSYLMLDGLVNAAGHCGHELTPRFIRERVGFINAVAHHDLHHRRFQSNFGQYFNVWDRLMGTFLDDKPAAPETPSIVRDERPRELRLQAGGAGAKRLIFTIGPQRHADLA